MQEGEGRVKHSCEMISVVFVIRLIKHVHDLLCIYIMGVLARAFCMWIAV